MDDFQILDGCEFTPEQIRQWGYDENLYLMEQDEDLLLHDTDYVPVLLELAADAECPKNDYSVSILGYYAQNLFLFRHREKLDAIANALADVDRSNKRIREFSSYFDWLYEHLSNPHSLQPDEMENLARNLLVGIATTRDFKCTNNILSGYTEYMCYTQSYHGYVYIHPQTCDWIQSRHNPLTSIGG